MYVNNQNNTDKNEVIGHKRTVTCYTIIISSCFINNPKQSKTGQIALVYLVS